ncbi:glycoside hydrolase family 88 protein [uncultured Draconibacterium sp.]|uniref:glycoside hydrolase family 88 protein n=1 Tax=uncultured Draconibacterium sp. TaxID=1573823 RepID=UPI0025D87F87|nr:glycoside hydrolase family 88 protein [uncultured Draconibacterium sp.]
MNHKTALLVFVFFTVLSCTNKPDTNQNVANAENGLQKVLPQLDLLLHDAYQAEWIPRTVEENGETRFVGKNFDWTEGFFPGTLWYVYASTNETKYKEAAEYFQNKFIEHRHLTTNHDLGFVFNDSFGAGYQLTGNEEYKQVLIDAGNSLIQRFNSTVGCIKSWDTERGWQAKRGWQFPVIIDNMMNLEMLFELSALTGDDKYKEVAISHANTTLKNHFRADNSSYHVVDYNPETGAVNVKHTAQGFAHESAWARGQAWGLYGFTVCYRYTRDANYLNQAKKIAEFYLRHQNLPTDLVPYWDFNAPQIPNEPRDASAAAIVASALIELDEYTEEDYLTPATEILKSLSSDAYLAETGTNNHFILKHSVGSIPHGAEIDKPLNYADYYYVEALTRLK